MSDYGECKIDTDAYIAGLKQLGITTIFEIHDYIEKAEEAAGVAIVEAGGQIIEFPASELAKWKAAAPDLLGDWVVNMDGRSMGDQAREVQDYWLNIINK